MKLRLTIIKILNVIPESFNPEVQKMGLGSHFAYNKAYGIGYWKTALSMITPDFIPRTICKFFDHKLECHGWSGPESGGEDIECTRCGYGWHHTYY